VIQATSEAVREGDDLLERVAPADPTAELRRERIAARMVLEIRVHRNAAGQIESITRAGDLASRRAVRVAATASEAERTAALSAARYGGRDRLLSHLRQRAWGPLGGRAVVQDTTLQWVPAGGQQEAVWIVTLSVQRPAGAVSVVATVDAGSGTVLSLARQGAL
jgi:hypothetical protein